MRKATVHPECDRSPNTSIVAQYNRSDVHL
jgi:hypothetical protein